MIYTIDPDAIFIGGGVIEGSEELREWYPSGIRNSETNKPTSR